MSADEGEYEVENVTRARVKSKRKTKITWEYLVKWKGYEQEDNTWEPSTSFGNGSEHILQRFWDRVDTGGRDINDAALFSKGDELYPQGPPRKAKKKQVPVEEPKETVSSMPVDNPVKTEKTTGNKRKRSSPSPPIDFSEVVSGKRTRVASLKSTVGNPTGRKKSLSEAIVEANTPAAQPPKRYGRRSKAAAAAAGKNARRGEAVSDDEMLLNGPPSDEPPRPSGSKPQKEKSPSPEIVEDSQGSDEEDSDDALFDEPKGIQQSLPPSQSTFTSASTSSLPSHRARKVNPLIKVLSDDHFGNGHDARETAIQTKARLLARQDQIIDTGVAPSRSSQSPVLKAGPIARLPSNGKNRSSLLTFDKGSLKTVKGKFTPTQNQRQHQTPVNHSSSSLNRIENGVGDDTMEVDAIMALDSSPQKPPTADELLKIAGLNKEAAEALPDFEDDVPAEPVEQPASISNSLAQAVGSLFPAQSSSSLFSGFSAPWKRSTIFDSVFSSSTNPFENSSSLPTFSLGIDSSITIPIQLKDIYQQGAEYPSLQEVVTQHPRGPPGKYYNEEVTAKLVQALTAGGSSARVEVEDNHQEQFTMFRGRLEEGQLFVGLAGNHVLAFYSSANMTVGGQLGAPEMLLGLAETIVVSRVVIQNHSAYADVAIKAEHVRW